ncbi:MAG TPA: hypothetical protein VFL57_03665, partial [Bryobacteraceae bacterium]|nr:hypothetical protein [Bryobacteraceae bacterium]
MRKQKWLAVLLLAASYTAWSGEWDDRLSLANQYLRSGRVAEAETLYLAAERNATTEQRGIVQSNLGAIAYSRAHFAEAERLYRRA